jgi:hypothetical protein
MPRATLDFDLPMEAKELEDALAGADAVRVLEGMRRWLRNEVTGCARAKVGSTDFHYARGIADARDELARLLAGGEHEHNADQGHDEQGDTS